MSARPRLPASIEETRERLLHESYVADRPLATAVFLALKLERPLFLEGQPGTGKTEIAKVLAQALGAELIRLQCYEGLDVNLAAYEWNYARQMLEIRLGEASHESREHIAASLFSERFLIARPLLRALLALDCMSLDPQTVDDTLGVLLKYQDDLVRVRGSEAARLLESITAGTAKAS